ncbi:uncharacterized protein LOC126897628 [Daktulosphaira vitifoliae]|uniref:uncharacterized protein LOC126897628 n=1 Tax=Daktulosphaira vitifoliae TaxID=58002 RepID=UPI0021A9CA5D|nr:uncharacterized protein LOC126897628 [Daktulosphaira vitifoliae]
MSYASILSKNLKKGPLKLKKLPEEKILLVIDLFKLSELDIKFGSSHFDAISSLTIIQRAFKYFVSHKNLYYNNQFAICLLTPFSYDLILDFTSDVKIISKELLLIPTSISITEDIAAYDFGPFLKFVAQLRSIHKDSIFRVVMSYNRDDCLPIIDSLDKNTYSIFSSPSFFFDIVYICKNNLEIDEMAQNIYGKLALLCNPWSYKICTQRKPMAIMNGISSLLPHPLVRCNYK